ncbi:hypothetical protein [Desulfocicer vacuolatum]|nr:hypothetical protein [Desulfocicer vacuolatum]
MIFENGSYKSEKQVYVANNSLDQRYNGESMDLAYFLAKYMTKKALYIEIPEHGDLWATGEIKEKQSSNDTTSWTIQGIDGLKAKIWGFLTDPGNDLINSTDESGNAPAGPVNSELISNDNPGSPSKLFIVPSASYTALGSLDQLVKDARAHTGKDVRLETLTMKNCRDRFRQDTARDPDDVITKFILPVGFESADLTNLIELLFENSDNSEKSSSDDKISSNKTNLNISNHNSAEPETDETIGFTQKAKDIVKNPSSFSTCFNIAVLTTALFLLVFMFQQGIKPVGWVSPAAIGKISGTPNHNSSMDGLGDGYWENGSFIHGKTTVLEEDGLENAKPGELYFGLILNGNDQKKISRIKFLSARQEHMVNHIKSFDIQIQDSPGSSWITVLSNLTGNEDSWNEFDIPYRQKIHGIRVAYTKVSYGAPTVLEFKVFIDQIKTWSLVLKVSLLILATILLLKRKFYTLPNKKIKNI